MEQMVDRTMDKSQRMCSFQRSPLLANDMTMTFKQLADSGYYFDNEASYICCSCCDFKIPGCVSDPIRLITEHGAVSPECETMLRSIHLETEEITNQTNQDNDDVVGLIKGEQETEVKEGIRESTLCMSPSDKRSTRFRAPLTVSSDNENLPSMPSHTPLSNSQNQDDQGRQRTNDAKGTNKQRAIGKPTCHLMEYDSYEGRLSSFTEWPSSSPMNPDDLARAGFYYTCQGDRVRCPYCLGGMHDWQSTDNVFSTHVKYSPKCEFIHYYTYRVLNQSVCIPETTPSPKSDVAAENVAVRAILELGYSADTVRRAIDDRNLQGDELTTENILVSLFKLGTDAKTSFTTAFLTPMEGFAPDALEGAVGGLDINNDTDTRTLYLMKTDKVLN